jgi:hypothetical protein
MAAPPNPRADRERKQKIFVAVGGLFLLALLAFQLPKLLGGSDSTAAGTTTTTTGAPAVAGGTTPPVDSAVPATIALVDTDRRLAPLPGQLRSFGRFSRKDPFVQQLASPSEGGEDAGPGPVATGGGKPADDGKKSPAAPSKRFTIGGDSALRVTVISVNGARQTVTPGMAFPRADPAFVLVSEQAGSKSVVVSVAGGAYANGDRATKLKLGQPLVLVNTATGARYRLVLVSVGNGSGSTNPVAPGSGQPKTPSP